MLPPVIACTVARRRKKKKTVRLKHLAAKDKISKRAKMCNIFRLLYCWIIYLEIILQSPYTYYFFPCALFYLCIYIVCACLYEFIVLFGCRAFLSMSLLLPHLISVTIEIMSDVSRVCVHFKFG